MPYNRFLDNFNKIIDLISPSINPEYFLSQNKLCLAVSGGPDSMLMLEFISRISKNIDVICIDHGIREESALELEFVKNYCQNLDIKFFGYKIDENLKNQADARKARLDIIHKYCIEQNINIILTAHHLDDLIENFFIRINRGSGIDGLNVIHAYKNYYSKKYRKNFTMIRPLFYMTKDNILKLCAEYNIEYKIDDSNFSNKYLRNKFRNMVISNDFFNKQHIVTTMLNIARSYSMKSDLMNRAIKRSVEIYDFGFAVINLEELSLFHEEIMLSSLSNVIMHIGGDEKIIRLKSLQNLLQKLSQNDFKTTLSNAIIEKIDNELVISQEIFNDYIISHKNYQIIKMTNKIWDENFKLTHSKFSKYKKYIPVLVNMDLKIENLIPNLKENNFYWSPKNCLLSDEGLNSLHMNLIYDLVSSENIG